MKTTIEINHERESLQTRVALHPFLAGMNSRHLALLTDCAMAARFKKGQTILREGDFANRFYLIESGQVALESADGFRDPVLIETLGSGDLLGWSWMFPPYVWNFTARAVEPTTAIFFYGTILREYCERDPSLGYELFKRMAPVMLRRLQRTRRKLLSIQARSTALEAAIVNRDSGIRNKILIDDKIEREEFNGSHAPSQQPPRRFE